MFPSSGTRWDPAWGRGACRGNGDRPNASPEYRALGGPPRWGGGHQRVRPQPGWTRGKVGCSGWDLSGKRPQWGPVGSAPTGVLVLAGAPQGCSTGAPAAHPAGDAELLVPQHRTCSPRTASLVWPVAPGPAAWTRPAGLRAASVST